MSSQGNVKEAWRPLIVFFYFYVQTQLHSYLLKQELHQLSNFILPNFRIIDIIPMIMVNQLYITLRSAINKKSQKPHVKVVITHSSCKPLAVVMILTFAKSSKILINLLV